MSHLYFCLRLLVIAIAFPVILLCLAAAFFLHPVDGIRNGGRAPLRLWMNVLDWGKGNPVGYSYWEQFQAPAMLDEIAVQHDHFRHED